MTNDNNACLRSEQKRGIYLTVAVAVSFVVLIVGLLLQGVNTPRILTSEELKNNGVFLFQNPRSFKTFALTDYNNQAFTPDNLVGKWSLIFFGFTYCPDICPTTMALLNRFYDKQQEGEYGNDLQIIMVSVDPARDTPEKLNGYVRFFNEAFIGVTGAFLDLHRFATQLNIPFSKVPGGGEHYTVEHSGNVAIINPQGHYVGFFRSPLQLPMLNLSYQSIRAAHQ
ncbi:MAG: SCO family protein [Pseudomonadales bacterium]